MEFTVPISCKILRKSCKEDAEFDDLSVDINVQEDTIDSLKKKLDMRGFAIYFGEILKDSDAFRTFYDGKEKLILLDCGADWEDCESENAALRICQAGFEIQHSLKALGRSVWHEGMVEFAQSAGVIKRLIDEGLEDYQNRSETVTLSELHGGLETVGVFNEYEESKLHFPPEPGVDFEGGDSKNVLAAETRELYRAKKGRVLGQKKTLERVATAVVRMYGYHPLKSPGPDIGGYVNGDLSDEEPESEAQDRVVPFTGFFVTPTLIMATKNCNYSKEHRTYAKKYMFSRRTRASYAFLTPGVDLMPCKVTRGMTEFLVERIRSIGVEVPEDIIPPENMATRWNDLLLFEVDEKFKSDVYLIPDCTPVAKGDIISTIAYHARPSEKWLSETFEKGGIGGVVLTERELNDHFWKYDIKCCSLGEAKDDERYGTINHMSSLLPSSLGSPILPPNLEVESDTNVYPFAAINCGRSRTDILSSEGAGGSTSAKRHNCGMTVRNLAFVLVYQRYVAPLLLKEPCYGQIKKFLQPYKILSERERLTACHVKMLKDADEFNEYGMSFYEDQQLRLALQCFREGARMFSIANIPDQTDYDAKLKDALQSNVSSVIMSMRDAGMNVVADD